MTDEHILMICAKYAEQLRDMGCPPMREVVNFHGLDQNSFKIGALRHCAFMVEIIATQIETCQREKAMRWLGFVQGVFYAVGYASVEDMKDMNRSSDNELMAKFRGWTPEQLCEYITSVLHS